MNRKSIKEWAKSRFLDNYWASVGIFVLLSLLGGLGSGGSGFSLSTRFNGSNGSFFEKFQNSIHSFSGQTWIIVGVFFLLAVLAGIAVSVFVSLPSQVSAAKAAVRIYDGGAKVSDVLYCFRDGRYMKHVWTMFLKNLFLSLPGLVVAILAMIAFAFMMLPQMLDGSESSYSIVGGLAGLLLILTAIPAAVVSIVIGLGLSQTEYLAADRGVFGMDAIRTSWSMMSGRKGELFVFELSFIGWELLSGITLGIVGIFFVTPYMRVSLAGFYRGLAPRIADPAADAADPEATVPISDF